MQWFTRESVPDRVTFEFIRLVWIYSMGIDIMYFIYTTNNFHLCRVPFNEYTVYFEEV